MAKLKNPLLSLGAVGRLAKDIVFARRRKVNIVEKKPIPKDVKSLLQLDWRHMYQKAVLLWHALSAAEKQEWESLARPKHMTGFAWFISQALKPNPGLYLPLQGGAMSGDIDMAKNRILKLPAPVDAQEAARLVDLVGVSTFLALLDTPAAYAGQALKGVRVNAAQNALEFAAIVGGYTEGARVHHSTTQSIPNETFTILAFNSERWDTDTIHDLVVNNSRLTCKTAGKYLIIVNASWDSNATGQRVLEIYLNGSTTIAGERDPGSDAVQTTQCVSTIYDLGVNDYVEVRAYQTSGGALNIRRYTEYTPEFMMQRIG